jgi:hypothetical protein
MAARDFRCCASGFSTLCSESENFFIQDSEILDIKTREAKKRNAGEKAGFYVDTSRSEANHNTKERGLCSHHFRLALSAEGNELSLKGQVRRSLFAV